MEQQNCEWRGAEILADGLENPFLQSFSRFTPRLLDPDSVCGPGALGTLGDRRDLDVLYLRKLATPGTGDLGCRIYSMLIAYDDTSTVVSTRMLACL